ncbi:CehA/McbA family metallohydrolase [Salibacterium aidingense]|uniref:CehA/McbA family metallohydrolase n=1 Tax=Salibacterium aidingense TaxID=384933 RepID=UPI003BDB6A84
MSTEEKMVKVTADQEGGYMEVPFHVASDTEKVEVSYSISRSGATVDLGVLDPSRIRGWSGGARDRFFITEHAATPGYLHGCLEQGEWAVLLGLHHIPEDGCAVYITIATVSAERRWLKGDMHSHTVHSDGEYTLPVVAEILKERKLDFIATTDHNTVTQNYLHPTHEDILFIPGFELTTNAGHSNIIGLEDPEIDFRIAADRDMEAAFKEAREKGAVIVINHPFHSGCEWKWSLNLPFDVWEVWNGPWSEENRRALQWWHEQLCLGYNIPITAGSDVHRTEKYVQHGMPSTWVLSEGKTKAQLLSAIRKGRMFITHTPEGPEVEMRHGDSLPGDSVPYPNEHPLKVSIRSLEVDDDIHVISDYYNESIQIKEGKQWEKQILIDKELFLRMEVWRYCPVVEDYTMILLTNPIYFTRDSKK